MKTSSLAVLALIGEASAVKIAKAKYWATADDFDEPSNFYQSMVQGTAVAVLDDEVEAPEPASDKNNATAQALAQPEKVDNDELSGFKALNKKAEEKSKKDAADKAADEQHKKYEKMASNSFDGLVHTEDGQLKFPDGGKVSGANSGVFAQVTDEANEKSKKEAEEYIVQKAAADKKAEDDEKVAKALKEENERWEKADRFTGTIHEKDGSKTFPVENTTVGGINLHA